MRPAAIAILLLPTLIAGAARADEESDFSLDQGTGNLPTVVVESQRPSGPGVSDTGAAMYGVGAPDIDSLPAGAQTPITDVLAQLPSVDINTNPPFISMLNPLFVRQLDLQVGVLPARYGYATGGVVDVESKDGCQAP